METIKEEKKADLEQLLNSLIEKGWKRKGKEKIEKATIRLSESWQVYFGTEEHPYLYADTLRGITSKNSGLWQFVCENGMVDKQHGYIEELKWWKADDDEEGHDNGEERYSTEYQFWLIESSLKDESELEDFLLQSIVINND